MSLFIRDELFYETIRWSPRLWQGRCPTPVVTGAWVCLADLESYHLFWKFWCQTICRTSAVLSLNVSGDGGRQLNSQLSHCNICHFSVIGNYDRACRPINYWNVLLWRTDDCLLKTIFVFTLWCLVKTHGERGWLGVRKHLTHQDLNVGSPVGQLPPTAVVSR